ncbi:DUF2922 domain-containing protein [Bacillus tianshenii]|nr:DUF2922 domain-containing protein [Bacillus tianshenii]
MKRLEMKFVTQSGSTATVSVDVPVEPLDPAVVDAAMNQILTQNIFTTSGGDFTAKKEARIVQRTITPITLP